MEWGNLKPLGQPRPAADPQLENWIRAAHRDAGALESLYQATRSAVYAFAFSILRNAHDAEDVLQETYIRLWGASEGYRPQGKPMAWLLRITRNLALSRLREGQKTTEFLPDAQLPAPEGLSTEDRLLLQALLDRLPDQSRQILTLHAVSGLKHREIAVLLDLPLPTVLSKYHRAVKALQKAWKESESQ